MACSKQAGPAAFLGFIEEATGEKITQTEWHSIRQLAAEHNGGISRRRVSTDESWNAARQLMVATREYSDDPTSLEGIEHKFYKRVMTTRNTEGTIAAIHYLVENGPLEVLETLREPKDRKKDEPSTEGGVAWNATGEFRDSLEPMADREVLDIYSKETDPNRKQALREEAFDRNLVDSHGDRFDSSAYTPKFRTDRQAREETGDYLPVEGTYLQGHVDNVSYSDLYNTFGEPLCDTFGEPAPSSDGKVQVEWVIEFETPKGPRVATIYDWKEGSEPQYIRNWNIGGKDELAVEYVNRALGRRY